MDEKKSSIGGVAWPSLLIVLVGLYAYWVHDRGLDSARPQDVVPGEVPHPIPRTGMYAVHARLWEDPIGVAYQDAVSRELVHPDDSPTGSLRDDRGTEVHDQSGDNPESPKLIEAAPSLLPTIQAGEAKGLDTILLPILVPGESSSEDKEQRLRIRYAVVTALSEAGFSLSYPTRVTYMVVNDVMVHATPQESRSASFVVPVKLYRPDDVRQYDPNGALGESPTIDGRKFQVIVLWINESQMGWKPLDVTDQIVQVLSGLKSDPDPVAREVLRGHVHVHVIGPSSSDTLIDIANEVQKIKEEGTLPAIHFFSPRATVGSLPFGAARPEQATDHKLIEVLEERHIADENEFQFVRVIGHDAVLVEALRHELLLRDAWWTEPGAGAPGDPVREVVLVTEFDTSYGRDVVNLFASTLRPTGNSPPNEGDNDDHNTETGHHESHLHVVRYLRGIDGQTARHVDREAGGRDDVEEYGVGGAGFADDRIETTHLYRPEGQSQFDYLLRLRDTLHEIERGEHHHDQNGKSCITAIGIVGTDIYDKLLILRALRTEFPRAVFFTTDLDAQFSHPAEYASTRNLIVASHFGLELDHPLQATTPPFRDSYETSTFLAVRMALGDPTVAALQDPKNPKNDPTDPWGLAGAAPFLHAHVYEIGRDGPLELIPAPDRKAVSLSWTANLVLLCACLLAGVLVACIRSVHTLCARLWTVLSPMRRAWRTLYGRFATSATGQRLRLPEWDTKPDTDTWPAWRTVAGVTLLGLLVARIVLLVGNSATHADAEPFGFTDAVSMWPSILLRMAAIAVAGCYFLTSCLMRETAAVRPHDLFKENYKSDDSTAFFSNFSEMSQRNWALISGGCTLLVAFVVIGIHHELGYRDFVPHTIRGESARTFAMVVHIVAVILALAVTVSALVRFEDCRRGIAFMSNHLRAEDPLVPYGAIRYIGRRTRLLRREIGWIVTLVVLLALPYHPRLDYSPMSAVSLAAGILNGGALLLWSWLVRRRAIDARRRAIRGLQQEKRFVNAVDSSLLPADDPWSQAVELSRGRHAADLGPEVSTIVATKVECELIDNEIQLIHQIDEGVYAPWYSTPAFAWLSGSAGVWAVLDLLLRAAQSGF